MKKEQIGILSSIELLFSGCLNGGAETKVVKWNNSNPRGK